MEKAEKYLIARVYNAMSDNSTVEFIKMQLDNVSERQRKTPHTK